MGTITASGKPVSSGTVAADPAVLPVGTMIRVAGAPRYEGVYRVTDTGSNIRGHRVDLYVPSCAEARRFGRRSITVSVLRTGASR
jgi:3D (Asp-Asp-Asp) domain-containing protein